MVKINVLFSLCGINFTGPLWTPHLPFSLSLQCSYHHFGEGSTIFFYKKLILIQDIQSYYLNRRSQGPAPSPSPISIFTNPSYNCFTNREYANCLQDFHSNVLSRLVQFLFSNAIDQSDFTISVPCNLIGASIFPMLIKMRKIFTFHE